LRTSFSLPAAAATLLLVAGCGSDTPERPDEIEAYGLNVETARLAPTLRLFNFPDYMDPELLAEFEEIYGVRVIQDFFDTNEAMIARLQAGRGGDFDLIVPSDYAVEILAEAGLLAEIDHGLLPNLSNLHPFFVSPPFDEGNRYSIPFQWGTTGIGLRTDRFRGDFEEAASWAILFDPARQIGRFALLDDPRETIGAALLYLGHDVNTTDDRHLAAAEAVLASAASRALAFTPATTGRDLLTAGEFDLSHNHSGEIIVAAEEDPAIVYLLPEEGAIVWMDNMAIPAGSPNTYTAHVFMNFILDAVNGARLTEAIWYSSPNLASWDHLDEELRAEHEGFLEPGAMDRLHFLSDAGSDRRKFDELWTRVKAGVGR